MKQKKMKKFWEWAASVDAIYVVGEFKGYGREDGYEAICYRSRSTGRYLIVTGTPRCWNHVWVANTEDDARQAYRQGYTPGNAPGRYHLVLAPERLREVRALRVNPEEGGKCDDPPPPAVTCADEHAKKRIESARKKRQKAWHPDKRAKKRIERAKKKQEEAWKRARGVLWTNHPVARRAHEAYDNWIRARWDAGDPWARSMWQVRP